MICLQPLISLLPTVTESGGKAAGSSTAWATGQARRPIRARFHDRPTKGDGWVWARIAGHRLCMGCRISATQRAQCAVASAHTCTQTMIAAAMPSSFAITQWLLPCACTRALGTCCARLLIASGNYSNMFERLQDGAFYTGA